MSDYFAGQQFFDFYVGELEEDEEVDQSRRTARNGAESASTP